MSLYNDLLQKFGYNEPILTNEISYGSYSKPWIYQELNRLVKSGEIIRFDKGVYYIPTQTRLGKSLLDPRKVIEKKYISSCGEVFGFYSGSTMLNRIGLSTQVPNVIEIYTNNESANVREVSVGKQTVMLRRARVEISKDNADTLCFLEMMNSITPAFLDEEKKTILSKFIRESGISRKAVTEYSKYFPDKALRNLIESEVIYDVAQ